MIRRIVFEGYLSEKWILFYINWMQVSVVNQMNGVLNA